MILTIGTTPALQRTMVFERFALDAVNRAQHVHEHTAGKAINAARIVHTLGENGMTVGFLGGDSGRFCQQTLERENIPHDFVQVRPPTRTCITIVDRATRHATELVEESPAVEPADVDALFQKIESHLPAAKMMILSGTLAPGVPDDFYARCLALANRAGTPTIIDGRGKPLQLALPLKPLLVKPNRSELEATLGRAINTESELLAAMKQLTQLGAGWVVVSRGGESTLCTDGKQSFTITPPKLDVLNPIGSGDSLAAGIAVGILRKLEMKDAIRLGIACGCANVTTMYSAHVDPAMVEQIYNSIGIA